jgi:hypothetical protein
MATEKLKGERSKEYIDRLCAMADKSINNIETQFSEMKEKGITGFCCECGCNLYADKEHEC